MGQFFVEVNSVSDRLQGENNNKATFGMETEIYKLNSLTDSVSSVLTTLSQKLSSKKGYEITLIVRQNQEETKMSSTGLQTPQQFCKVSKKNSVNFAEDTLVFGSEQLSHTESGRSFEENPGSTPAFNQANKKDPNHLRNILNKLRLKGYRSEKESGSLQIPQPRNEQENVQDSLPVTPPVCEISLKIGSDIMDDSLEPPGGKVVDSDLSSSRASGVSEDSEAGFLIEHHLGQAVEMVEAGDVDRLEDFLYDFKEKHYFVNERVEIKWSLLMAHCKQSKMQYERASTNYKTVANALSNNPRLIPGANLGEVYAHLGNCHFQLRQWNRGIAAMTKALNIFREHKRYSDYAGCLMNLGQLYLQTGYYSEAERCLLKAHGLKRGEAGDRKAKTNIVQILLLLVDCNMKLQNFKQAAKVLNDATIIIEESNYIDVLLLVGMHIRKASLSFITGKHSEVEYNCQQAMHLLSRHHIESREYAEIFELLGSIKMENGNLERSKIYFEKALKVVAKYQATDSPKVTVLRKRIEQIGTMLQSASARSKNHHPTSLRSQPI